MSEEHWMPIETAPKDGTWIIVTSTHNKYFRAALQYEMGQWIDSKENVYDRMMEGAATHWQPLPSPPSP